MEIDTLLILGAIFILLIFSGIFSGSETALTAASQPRMHLLEQQGDRRALIVTKLYAQREKMIGAILLLIALAAEPIARFLQAPAMAESIIHVILWIALLAVGSLITLTVLEEKSGRPQSAEKTAAEVSVEAEDMRVVAKSRDFTFWLQPTTDFPAGRWSKDGQMFAHGARKGDWIELELPEREPGSYRLELILTRSMDYGIVAVSFNGIRVGEEIDLLSRRGVVPTDPLDLGPVELRGSGDVLRLEVTGANPASRAPFFQFGIDGVRLTRN